MRGEGCQVLGGWCGVCEGKERTTFNVLILAFLGVGVSEPYWSPCHLVSSSMWTHELGSLQLSIKIILAWLGVCYTHVTLVLYMCVCVRMCLYILLGFDMTYVTCFNFLCCIV